MVKEGSLQEMVLGQLDIVTCKGMKLDPYLIPHTKINLKNVFPLNYKVL